MNSVAGEISDLQRAPFQGAEERGFPHQRSELNTNLATLDVVRGIAALEVLLGHLRVSSFVEFSALPEAQQGALGKLFFAGMRMGHEAVLVFFVLSGYLVGGQVIRRIRRGSFSVADYAIDRTTRIFIPLWPACALTAIVATVVLGEKIPPGQILANAVGLNGVISATLPRNAPLWTLAYEIWFYILAGAIGAIAVGYHRLWFAIVALLAGSVFTVLSPAYLVVWLIGAAVATLRRPPPGVAILSFLSLCVGVLGYQSSLGHAAPPSWMRWPPFIFEGMVAVGFALIIPAIVAADRWFSGRLRIAAAFVGGCSYSIYLFHFPLIQASTVWISPADSIGLSSLVFFALKLFFLLLACVLLWWVFERQTFWIRLMLRKRLMSKNGSVPGV